MNKIVTKSLLEFLPGDLFFSRAVSGVEYQWLGLVVGVKFVDEVKNHVVITILDMQEMSVKTWTHRNTDNRFNVITLRNYTENEQ